MNIDINDMPLSVIVDCFRNELFDIQEKYKQLGVPTFILEGVLSEALSEARGGRAREVADGYSSIIAKMQKDDESEENTEETSE